MQEMNNQAHDKQKMNPGGNMIDKNDTKEAPITWHRLDVK